MYHIGNASVIYVSQTQGNDRLNGLSPFTDDYGNGPLQTLERAFRSIADLRVTGLRRPMYIALTEDYYMDNPITIPSDVSAVTIQSWGTRKRLIGGIRITGWQWDHFQGVPCLKAKLPPKKDGSHWSFTDLYVNGIRAASPRFPKEGTLRAVQTENESETLFDSSQWFIADTNDLSHLEGIEDAIVNYYHWWVDAHTPVSSYDRETGKLTLAYNSRFAINTMYENSIYNKISSESPAALHYYLTNIPTMFGQTNDWYLDRKNDIVYYIPEDSSINPDTLEAYAPCIPYFFSITTDDIHIRNLEFLCTKGDYVSRFDTFADHTDPQNPKNTYAYCADKAYATDIQSVCWASGSISFENASRCSIFDCHIHGVGIHAIEIKTGCRDIRIEGNRIEDICAGGIKIYGRDVWENPERTTEHCIIRGNIITNCGKRYAAGCGILVCHSSNNEISENEISYLDYSGISLGWVWGYEDSTTFGNLIRGNHIHHIGMGRLSDMGGIYTLGKQPGTRIIENRIHDVYSSHYGGWGIYTDEGSSYITIENNVIYNTKSECYNQHYGSFNTVRNNIFAFGSAGIRIDRPELHDGILFDGNIILMNNAPAYNDFCSLSSLNSSNNIFWDSDGEVKLKKKPGGGYYDLEEWTRKCGKDFNSVIANPGFTDAANFDFSLEPDSNAAKHGFKPLTGFLATGKK